ncbi:ATP-dependent DNA helicase PcrA [Candidatus Magnetoovum chiemensis]|nr:ATP-dependent DNA helicase PcrA [Candidatus Magnetoovum chiemensis]
MAGAGSGKTKVLTHKYAFLYKNANTAKKEDILTVTYTNKAAAEMKSRIEKLINKQLNNEWIGTLHSKCTKILRQEIPKLGLKNDFVIYDLDDQSKLIRHILNDLKEYEALYKGIISKICCYKSSFLSPDEQISNENNFAFDEKLRKVYSRYKDELKKSNALDCLDLILYTIQLFEQYPDVLSTYQNKFSYILVDEFQDTNYAQYHLLKLLANKNKNILVAGDDDQSIYKYKGADISNILKKFEEDFPSTKIIKLEQNYRNTENIINVSRSVICKNNNRKIKNLWSERGQGDKVFHHWFDGENDEAKYLSKTIKELYLKGTYTYNDMAVFYRVPLQSKMIEDALKNERIPFKVVGESNCYQQKEVKDLISYIRLIYNRDDNVSLRRALNMLPKGIGATTLNKIENIAKKEAISLYASMNKICSLKGVSPSAKEKVTKIISLITELSHCKTDSVSDTIKEVAKITGYVDALDEQRLNIISEFMLHNEGNSMDGFLDCAALSMNGDDEHNKDGVTLTTLHNVKGLEFNVVFITGLEDGLIPYFKAEKEEDLDEERRLLYVGMTRAKDILLMSGASKRKLYASLQQQEPSRFLNDLPSDYCVMMERKLIQTNSQNKIKIKLEEKSDKDYPYNPGCRVKHSKWGVGVIRDCYGEDNDIKVTVNFPNVGIKRLSLKYANLERI